ncbi:hypothetical protein [Pseudonocardia sp. NPDC049635]|uniref:hypothetical protein n=1 Tax=Pseudonocardia sp. NPDC049635 TaxID=3155506 RepID=UPI0033E45147
MADRVTLASLGKARWYAEEVNAGRGVLLVVLLADGAEADGTLVDRATLAAVLGVTANKEAAWPGGTGYERKSYSSVAVNVSTANDRVDLAITNPTWSTAGDPNDPYKLSKIGVCFAPSAGAANSAIVPLAWLDFPSTVDGSNLVFAFDAAGFYRSQG